MNERDRVRERGDSVREKEKDRQRKKECEKEG